MCGLEIQVEDGRVACIRGNREDTWSRGHLCPKGASLGAIHEDPDRIRTPMIKVDGRRSAGTPHSGAAPSRWHR
jgi:anaerobic selenocysteine-containing dehydrogenase